MFQCGPEPEFVIDCTRLSDGRTLAVFFRDNKIDADLFVTDGSLPELWKRLASGTETEMRIRFRAFVQDCSLPLR